MSRDTGRVWHWYHIGLLGASALGYVVEYFAFKEYLWLRGRGGDGFQEMGPAFALLTFGPLQLATATLFMLAFTRSVRADEEQSALDHCEQSAGMYGLADSERSRTQTARTRSAGTWLLCLPAGIMAICVLLKWLGAATSLAYALVVPGALAWAPVWFAGLVAAFITLSRESDSSLLLVAGLYPLLVLAYAWL